MPAAPVRAVALPEHKLRWASRGNRTPLGLDSRFGGNDK